MTDSNQDGWQLLAVAFRQKGSMHSAMWTNDRGGTFEKCFSKDVQNQFVIRRIGGSLFIIVTRNYSKC